MLKKICDECEVCYKYIKYLNGEDDGCHGSYAVCPFSESYVLASHFVDDPGDADGEQTIH